MSAVLYTASLHNLVGGVSFPLMYPGGGRWGAASIFGHREYNGHPFSAVRRPIVAVLGQFKGHAKQTVVSYLGYAQFCTQHS